MAEEIALVDSHAHLTDPVLSPELPEIVQRAVEAGVVGIVCAGYDLESSRMAVELANMYPQVYATVGVHPNYSAQADILWRREIERLVGRPKVVGIGETGLDKYRQFASLDVQIEWFRWHLKLAQDAQLPVVVHNRDANQEVGMELEAWVSTAPCGAAVGMLHCFSADVNLLDRLASKGFYISFAGPITYKRPDHLLEAARKVPEDLLLVETDSPYLAPEPFRGRRNEPARLVRTAQKLADIRGVTLQELARLTTRNACRLFRRMAIPHCHIRET